MSNIFLQQRFRSLIKIMPNFDLTQNVNLEKYPELKYYLDFYLLPYRYNNISIGKIYSGHLELAMSAYSPVEINNNNSVVLFIHGYFDHVGLYKKFINFLLANDIRFFGLDLPGHGLSMGKLAHIVDFGEYVRALEVAISTIEQQVANLSNIILVGYSTGATIIMDYLMHHHRSNYINKSILLSPLIRINDWHFTKILLKLFPGFQWVNRKWRHFSHDYKFVHFVRYNDPLQWKYVQRSWLEAMFNWDHRFNNYWHDDYTEIVVLQGMEDKTVDWQYNAPSIAKKYLKNEISLFSGAYHDLLNESECYRDLVYAKILTYLKN